MDIVEIPLGALDTVRGARPGPSPDLPDGALAECVNLRPVVQPGDVSRVAYEPVRPPGDPLPGVASAQSAFFQVRQRAVSDGSSGAAGALRRWLVLTPSQLRAVDETGAAVVVHSFTSDTSRRASFAPLGSRCVVTPRVPDGQGGWKPDGPALVVEDADAYGLGSIPWPTLSLAPQTAPDGGQPAHVFFRAALDFEDGTTGPAGPLLYRRLDYLQLSAGRVAVGLQVNASSVSADWRARSKGATVYAALGESPEEALAAPLVEIYRVTWGQSAFPFTSFTRDELEGRRPLRDDTLLAHGVGAACCATYNGRVLLGSVAYDFAPPAQGGDGHTQTGTVWVRLRTGAGDIWVSNPGGALSPGGAGAEERAVSYPDRRAVEMVQGGRRWSLNAPSTMNVAWAEVDADGATGESPTAAGAFADHDPNLIAYTEPSGLAMPAANQIAVGDGPADGVRAILPLSDALSEGQFGAFPIAAACARSVWTLETGGDPFVIGRAPMVLGLGAPSAEACAVLGGRVAIASTEGLRLLGPGQIGPSLSVPIESELLRAALENGEGVLGVHYGDYGEELWVTTKDSLTPSPLYSTVLFCLHLGSGRWYERSEVSRTGFARRDGDLVGIVNGSLVAENAGEGPVTVRLTTAPVDLGARDSGGDVRFRRVLVTASGRGPERDEDNTPLAGVQVLRGGDLVLGSDPLATAAATTDGAGMPVVVVGSRGRGAFRVQMAGTFLPAATRFSGLQIEGEVRRSGRRLRQRTTTT